jgi:hypothetical protein
MVTLNIKLYIEYAISPEEGPAEGVSALLRGETRRDNYIIIVVNTRVRMTVLGLEAKGTIMTAQL